MKSLILLLTVVLTTHLAIAQSYSFSHSTETYQVLSSPTIISNPGWDDEQKSISIPFPFRYFDVLQSTIYLTMDGYIYFTSNQDDEIILLGADLKERSMMGLSDVSYQVTGTAPDRILKIQWRNAGLYEDTTNSNFLNFQFWLHETSNYMTLHFGNSNASNLSYFEYGGPFIGLLNYDGTESYLLSGNPANPVMQYNPSNLALLSAMPSSGIMYTFITTSTNVVKKETFTELKHYPNPANQGFTIDYSLNNPQKVKFSLHDLNGRLIIEKINTSMQTGTRSLYILTENLPSGVYFYTLTGDDFNLNNKVIVNR